jgi:hypothetical protein
MSMILQYYWSYNKQKPNIQWWLVFEGDEKIEKWSEKINNILCEHIAFNIIHNIHKMDNKYNEI